jgi:hypothetical protein
MLYLKDSPVHDAKLYEEAVEAIRHTTSIPDA